MRERREKYMIPTLTPDHFISGLNKPQEDYGTGQIRGVVRVFLPEILIKM
jgi:hypothetical protein